MAKMSLQDLKDLFPSYDPQGFKPSRATNKGYKHKVNAPWKRPPLGMLLREWKKLYNEQRMKKRNAKRGRAAIGALKELQE